MSTETYDARQDPDVVLLSPYYDELPGSRALAYIRKSDELPAQLDFAEDEALDPLCKVKLFNPVFRFWLAAYNPQTMLAYGVAEMMHRHGATREAGDLPMREIISERGPLGVILERDLYYVPKKMSELLEEEGD